LVRKSWNYRTNPVPRIQITTDFVDSGRQKDSRILLVDTGCPLDGIIDFNTAERMNHGYFVSSKSGHFGEMQGYLMKIVLPTIHFEQVVPFWSNQKVTQSLASEGFDGMIGLPLLQKLTYGGNAIEFFLEKE
jgi:hypothetical protein